MQVQQYNQRKKNGSVDNKSLPGCLVVTITPMDVVAFSILKTTPVRLCPAKHRLSRAPPVPSRPRDRATPAPHGHPSVSSGKDRAPQSNSASGERGKVLPGTACSIPVLAGDHKKYGNPNTTQQQTVHEYCCSAAYEWVCMVGGCVGGAAFTFVVLL